jgi:hypothetical protein
MLINIFSLNIAPKLTRYIQGDQKGLFELVILNFIFKWYNWSNLRLLTA